MGQIDRTTICKCAPLDWEGDMISSFELRFGSGGSDSTLTIPATPVIVFVGPNNSGKSKALREISTYCRRGSGFEHDVIVKQISFNSLSDNEVDKMYEAIQVPPQAGYSILTGHVTIGDMGENSQVDKNELLRFLKNSDSLPQQFCGVYLRYRTRFLDGANRIGIVGNQQAGDLQSSPKNSLQYLFQNNDKRKLIRKIIHDAFGSYFVIDPTNMGQLRIRLSPVPPSSEIEERGYHESAVSFHSRAQPIDLMSDGVKAFTGIMMEVLAGDPDVFIIDEPEAFLHPTLAFKLGLQITNSALDKGKRVIAATHSPNFVMGCLSAGVPVNIVRLTYRNGVPTARLLDSSTLSEMMRNPLLRSAGVIGALFYEFVVVTEADTDRAFYQEVNERLLRNGDSRGIPNALFLNAQNKQTVKVIIEPLRKLGIPTAGIVDIDVIKDGGRVWSGILSSISVPPIDTSAFSTARSEIISVINAMGADIKRNGGVNSLIGSDREALVNLIERLMQYGLFVVKGGEVESWLSHLGVSGHGPSWLIEVFRLMGENPEDPSYVSPAAGDVWAFLGQLNSWFSNPERLGIPR